MNDGSPIISHIAGVRIRSNFSVGNYLSSEDFEIIWKHIEGLTEEQIPDFKYRLQLLFDATDMGLPVVASRVNLFGERSQKWTLQTDNGIWVTTSVECLGDLEAHPDRFTLCDGVLDAINMLHDSIALTQL